MWINQIIIQILLYQACLGIQSISIQRSGCQPLEENLNAYVCSYLHGEVDLSNSSIWELPKNLEYLTISDSENLTINLETLKPFTKLTHLIFQDSQVSEFKLNVSTGPDQIKVIKFLRSWSHCPEGMVYKTANCELHLLDLNTLGGLEEMHIINSNISKLNEPELPILLNITGGRINCLVPEHEKLPQEEKLVDFLWMQDWIKNKNAILSDDVMCFVKFINFNGGTRLATLRMLSIKNYIEINQETRELCPSKCKCYFDKMDADEWRMGLEKPKPVPKVEVDCNNISLANLPNIIPKLTTSFLASHNNISDINQIFENDYYLNIDSIKLDHNQIRKIDDGKFYNYLLKRDMNFELDLSYNQITELPIGSLHMIFKEQWYPSVYIHHNPLNCSKINF